MRTRKSWRSAPLVLAKKSGIRIDHAWAMEYWRIMMKASFKDWVLDKLIQRNLMIYFPQSQLLTLERSLVSLNHPSSNKTMILSEITNSSHNSLINTTTSWPKCLRMLIGLLYKTKRNNQRSSLISQMIWVVNMKCKLQWLWSMTWLITLIKIQR